MKVNTLPAKPSEAKRLRIAVYSRVSADKDAAFHSLEAQNDYYEKYVAAHPDWELVSIFSDNAISGTIVDRPAFQEMLRACRRGAIDLVISKSITRFARNTVVLLETIRELKALGIDCFFEKENLHSISPDGELFITLLAMYAEEEARSASENQLWRIRKKFENGEPWSGNLLGYRLIDGEMVIVPEEAEIVRQIFELYLSGMGRQRIAKTLAEQGVVAPVSNAPLSAKAVVRILRNEKYIGDMLLQKSYCVDFRTKKRKENHGERRQYYVENSHEAIIDKSVFEAVQAEIARRQMQHEKSRSIVKPLEKSPFVGLLVCGICGCHFTRKRQKIGSYEIIAWCCNTYDTRGKDFCPSQRVPDSILNEKAKEVLGVDELTRELLLKRIERIIVPEHNHLTFALQDGRTEEVFWKHASRRKSWTPEMRQKARERSLRNTERRRNEQQPKSQSD